MPLSFAIIGYLILSWRNFMRTISPPGNAGAFSTTWMISCSWTSASSYWAGTGVLYSSTWVLSSASASIEKSSLIWAVFSTIFSTINGGGGAEEGRGITLCNLHQLFNLGIDPLVAISIYINRVINHPLKATNATAMENIRPIWKNIPFLLSRSAFSDFLSSITYIIMPAILILLSKIMLSYNNSTTNFNFLLFCCCSAHKH